jgi:hypothetical protein
MKRHALTCFGWMSLVAMGSSAAIAGYNTNMTGTPTAVSTYANGLVLFILSNQPSTHPQCNPAAFAVDPTLDPHILNRMYARLLAAEAAGQPVNIGFDNTGDCVSGFIHVHEVG